MGKKGRLVSALALAALAVGCRSTRTAEHKGVPLVWVTSQETPVAAPVNLAPHRFKVARMVDKRQDPTVFGTNVQDPNHPLLVTTKDDVAAWATDRFAAVLKRQGFEVVESGQTITLEPEILKLMVTEAGLFNGEVELGLSVRNAKGEVVWRGALAGRSKRFGRTFSLDNYYEALTNAFEAAAKGLPADFGFLKAISAG